MLVTWDRDRVGIFARPAASTYVLQSSGDEFLQLVQASVDARASLPLEHRLHNLSVLISL